MKRVLVTYYSDSGSTEEIAQIISQTITNIQIDVKPIAQVVDLKYDAIIIGSPNKYGKPAHDIIRFIKDNEAELSKIPITFFFSCMDCYMQEESPKGGIGIYCDSHFGKLSDTTQKLSSWEKSHAVSTYLDNLKKISSNLKIQSLAFFKGRLDFSRLKFFDALVMRFICLINKNIRQGDYLIKKDIEEWCQSFPWNK